MVAALSTLSAAWRTGNLREYDVWGTVRTGQQTGSPANRHCANLGHVSDDESGVTYMRARYYEPTTGRFISEDPAGDGGNWYVYCASNPVAHVDKSGEDYLPDNLLSVMLTKLSYNLMEGGMKAKIIASAALLFMKTWLLSEFFLGLDGPMSAIAFSGENLRKYLWLQRFSDVVSVTHSPGYGSVAQQAEAVTSTYSMMITLAFWIIADEIYPN